MEQKKVKLIGLRAENHGIIKTAVLTPDILRRKLITINGEMGNGKSTLIDMFKTAINGTDAIRKKDILEKGYLAEAQILDGDINLWLGAQVTEFVRGEKAGEPKFETVIYAKDANGKRYTPIIDGVQATASDYVKMLTTELTFSMPELFSENQTAHRKLIEDLFKPELDKLGAEAVIDKIAKLRKDRDAARSICQNRGAHLEAFKREGFAEKHISQLRPIDIAEVEEKITQKKIERDRLVNAPETAYLLAEEKAKGERERELQKIKDEGVQLRAEIDKEYNERMESYNATLATDNELEQSALNVEEACTVAIKAIRNALGCRAEADRAVDIINEDGYDFANEYRSTKANPTAPTKDEAKSARLVELGSAYQTLQAKPLSLPAKGEVDTTEIDNEIASLTEQKQGAQTTNDLVERYQLYIDKIETEGKYQSELDVLRKLYASINTGVEGLKITPRETASNRVEIWVTYNGCYDTEFFHNDSNEDRMMFEYSSFQRTVIGLMLQAARLNLKPKALRLAFIDEVAFTENGLNILRDITEKLDIQLIVAWTREADKDNLSDGQILVDGGEIFFNKAY